jgi:hypothetical protein
MAMLVSSCFYNWYTAAKCALGHQNINLERNSRDTLAIDKAVKRTVKRLKKYLHFNREKRFAQLRGYANVSATCMLRAQRAHLNATGQTSIMIIAVSNFVHREAETMARSCS